MRRILNFYDFTSDSSMNESDKPLEGKPKEGKPSFEIPKINQKMPSDYLGKGGGLEGGKYPGGRKTYARLRTKAVTDLLKLKKDMEEEGFMEDCEESLKGAKEELKKLFASPITARKFRDNYEKSKNTAIANSQKSIFKKYLNAIENLEIAYYTNSGLWQEGISPLVRKKIEKIYPTGSKFYKEYPDAIAFVLPEDPELNRIIFVNCVKGLEKSMFDEMKFVMIHEIQHLLFKICPINPEAQIGKTFIGPGEPKSSPLASLFGGGGLFKTAKDLYFKLSGKKSEAEMESALARIKRISKETSSDTEAKNIYFYWTKLCMERGNSQYIDEITENASRIIAMRSVLGVSPGKDISKKMILPYILRKESDTNISWLLLAWAKNGFKDLDQFLNGINALAKSDQASQFGGDYA